MVTVDPEALEAFAAETLEATGATGANARQVAASLVGADRRGHGSHGVIRIPQYARMAEEGALDPEATPDVAGAGPTTARVEGNRAFGQVVGRTAVPALVERASERGTAAVGVRDATHLGRIGEWAERTVSEGLVFAAFVNTQGSGLSVAPAGSAERKLATNPVAVGVPTFGELEFPLVFDAATSQVAHGKVRRHEAAGKELPEGWAVDGSGDPVTDAAAFEAGAGALLPLGGEASGYKGFGFAVVTELLAGVVGDAPVAGTGESEWFGNAAAFVALDPLRFTTEAGVRRRVRGLVAHLRAASYPDAVGAGHAAREGDGLLPGEAEREALRASAESGVDVPGGVADELRAYARSVGVAPPDAFE
jgi:uncharacterized oxidoreductase